jgi:hypothetical protein
MVERRRGVDHIEDKLDDLVARLDEHLADADHKFSALSRAFPDGVEGHRAAHEAMINAAKAQEQFWRELRLDMAKKGLWAVFVVVCGLILTGLSIKLGWGPK